jgi:hypothetical protein
MSIWSTVLGPIVSLTSFQNLNHRKYMVIDACNFISEAGNITITRKKATAQVVVLESRASQFSSTLKGHKCAGMGVFIEFCSTGPRICILIEASSSFE